MTQETKLIKQRAAYKGQLTSFANYISELDESSLDDVEVDELQLRIARMEKMFDRFEEVQLSLECVVDESESQQLERNEFEKQYYKLLSRARKIHNGCKRAESVTTEVSQRRSCVHNNIKLPIIQLPKFSGSYDNWLEFHDTFTSLIHNNDDIDNINKFHYLRASLEGSAAVVIQSIEFSSANYSIAWQLLCDRFDNNRLLIHNHVSAIFNLEIITKESSANLKRLLDQTNKHLRALETLGEPTKHWDTLLIYIITHKLDSKTYREWEQSIKLDKKTTFSSFLKFIKNRADLLETIEMSINFNKIHNNLASHNLNRSSNKLKTLVSVSDNCNKNSFDSKQCPKCGCDHKLINCPQFLSLTNESRLKLLPEYKVCFNCLQFGHYANNCKKPGCKVCRRKHNTLVHVLDRSNKPVSAIAGASHSATANNDVHTQPPATNARMSLTASVSDKSHRPYTSNGDVLLSTALIKVFGKNNKQYVARALLDSGSTNCLMSEAFYDKLRLPFNNINNSILGINNATSQINKSCRLRIKSLDEHYTTNVHCFILPSITNLTPCKQVDLSMINIPSEVCLADPHFDTPAAIDILIGADVFWDILGTQRLRLGDGLPILCDTKLGWLVSGPIKGDHVSSSHALCNFTEVQCDENVHDVQYQLAKFWQLEEVSAEFQYSSEERACENHFIANTTRLEDGRFCVRIPLKRSPELLGDSFPRAKQCFLSLERRLNIKPKLLLMYKDFMSEYELLGHMSKCTITSNPSAHYIPHHGVLRECSSTTKLRVVFNASSPTSTGVSFNQLQMVGPVVQDDLLSILLRFRKHKYIIAADVEKMYRQVSVHPDDRHLQQVLWRDTPSDTLQAYQLNTVTYGTASAPYLATRCLKQLGLETQDKKVTDAIIHDCYVDDLLTGGDNLKEVIKLRHGVTSTLASAQMNLRKWKSNEPRVLPKPESPQSSLDLNIGTSEPSKTLGLGWLPGSDQLCFPSGLTASGNTKRDILSVIAQIFDPLGLLAPCVIVMKILLQQLWLEKLSWDEQISPEINKIWTEIIVNLSGLNNIYVPRRVICDSPKSVEFHIFSDASERAYGACLYVRSSNDNGEVMVRLLLAKSRVAPLKTTTIPRLELCGALVGTRLYEKVLASLKVQVTRTVFWTDSTIVLGWLRTLPSKLQPFVRNRVAAILDKTGDCQWRHVGTEDNPADYISRGLDIKTISTLDKWWLGPSFLCDDASLWPSAHSAINNDTLPELKSKNISLHSNIIKSELNNDQFINFNRYSNFSRLNRAVAFVLRFIGSCRKQISSGPLRNEELQSALNVIIRVSQSESFPEYKSLIYKKELPKKSSLLKFNVFLDDNKIMRVGGRLANSDYLYEKKYPILLQSAHRFTKLLFEFEHRRLLHAGPQLLLSSIRERYWPIRGRNLARHCCRLCVKCWRMKGQTPSPIMGDLPQQRLLAGFPFENVGLDYAGPIQSASRQGRGCKLVKVYIAIFVCFTTKAIHLELVGDLTSNTFLMALRRFISRRGKPTNIYSDNGTSFVGAYNDISKFLKDNCDSLTDGMASEGINFHFIPAYSPHFAGLAEAGVKSTKHHLIRVLGNCYLTYEELSTTLVQIEAVLNSRPLTPLSSDPEDLMPLTPGHFIIGRPLTSLPSPNYQDRSTNSLTRFQRIEQLRQHFWIRWSKEYVSELQVRTKWRASKGATLTLNSLVLLKEENLPPLKWKLGRIVAVYPGTDGVTRVADIKTSSGLLRRSFSKICPLPAIDNSS